MLDVKAINIKFLSTLLNSLVALQLSVEIHQFIFRYIIVNPLTAKLHTCNLNFHPLEVVSRYRDSQLQVGGNCPYLFNLRPKTFANIDV